MYVILYLAAIVAANLAIAQFGPVATIPIAFVLIGLDLVARDALHEAWHGNRLVFKMALLIATGSLLSWWLNHDAGRIALASFVAFALAGVTDAVVYGRLYQRGWLVKVNGSNVGAAAVDSVAFPALAFGLSWAIVPVMVGQFVAKTAGGGLWSLILRPLCRASTRPAAGGERG